MSPSDWLPVGDAHRLSAVAALALWDGDATSLEHIANSGNFVYRFRAAGTRLILRLTNPRHRTFDECVAETAFLRHLQREGVAVSTAVASRHGNLVEEIAGMPVSVFTWAPGARVDTGPKSFYVEWGRALSAIHRAARSYTGPARWHWTEEDLVANARNYIPHDDAPSLRELDRVMTRLGELPETGFGMIHADYGAQNFHYDEQRGITTFDFGNCCHHWYASDLAISLTTIRNDEHAAWVVEGYGDAPEHWAERDWFRRLRILYFYLSRLKFFGPVPTDEQRGILVTLRERVHAADPAD